MSVWTPGPNQLFEWHERKIPKFHAHTRLFRLPNSQPTYDWRGSLVVQLTVHGNIIIFRVRELVTNPLGKHLRELLQCYLTITIEKK